MNAPPNRRFTVGLTIPAALLLVAGAEVALRWVSLEKFAFRSLEALASPESTGGPFLPSRRYENSRTYGDLAGLGNLRSLRRYRREVFTTDRFGYRNREDASIAPAAILIGDSFGIAPGVDDSETLSAQLARLWGRGVYNAAGMFRMNDVRRVRVLARRLGMRRGLVVWEFLERQETPSIPPTAQRRGTLAARSLPEQRPGLAQKVVEAVRHSSATSRIRILAERTYRLAQNDRFLPNPMRENVAIERLSNGESILFLPEEIASSKSRRRIVPDYWRWARDELGKAGLALVVVLVPNKYTIYGPLLLGSNVEADPPATYLSRLESELKGAGIEVVNLEPVYREAARRGLAARRYVYFPDDTHWTPLGIRLAAERVAAAAPLTSVSSASSSPAPP